MVVCVSLTYYGIFYHLMSCFLILLSESIFLVAALGNKSEVYCPELE